MRTRTPALIERDVTRLRYCDEQLVTIVLDILSAMNEIGFPMFVTQGFRTVAQQQALFAQGRTAPGAIVTHMDGVIKVSKHQSGRAVDLAFIDDTDTPKVEVFDPTQPWSLLGAMAEARALRWGGRQDFVDWPHVELP